jgi:hypothetical protein
LEGEGEMKNIIRIVILAAVFLYGYDLGRAPGSHDIVGWLKVKSGEAYVIGKDLVASVSDDSESMAGSEEYPR